MVKALFITHYTELYGANRSLLNTLDGLKSYNVNAIVIGPHHGKIEEELKKREIPYYVFPFHRWIHKRVNFGIKRFFLHYKSCLYRIYSNFMLLPKLKEFCIQQQIKLVYTNSSVTPIGAMLAKALKLPHIWHLREFGDHDFGLTWDFNKGIIKYCISKYSNAVVCISKSVYYNYLVKRFANKFHIIYNGIFTNDTLQRIKDKSHNKIINRNSFSYAIIGSIQEGKGQGNAIKAFDEVAKEIAHARLIIIGEGAKESLFKEVSSSEHKNHINIMGHIDDMDKIYSMCDVVLMCSKKEGLGRVTIEAMAYGKPVIGNNSGGTAEIIKDDVNGLLYNGNYNQLAEKMILLAKDQKLYMRLRNNAFNSVKKNFLTETYAVRLHQVIEDVKL